MCFQQEKIPQSTIDEIFFQFFKAAEIESPPVRLSEIPYWIDF